MSFFGEITPRAADVTRNIRNKSKKESEREFYVDSGRELEVDDAVIRLEEHAVRAREFLAVSQVVTVVTDDNTDDNSTSTTVSKQDDPQTTQTLSGQASRIINQEVAKETPSREVIARALVDEAHTTKTVEETVIELSNDKNGETQITETRYIERSYDD